MKAIIQGEGHIVKKDREDLLDRVSEDTDGVFIEGREDNISLSRIASGYAFFLAGMVIYFGFIRSLRNIRMHPLQEKLEEMGIPFHDEIDKEIPDIYSEFPGWANVPMAAVFLLTFVYLFQRQTPPVVQFGSFTTSTTALVGFILILLSPIAYFSTVIQLESLLVEGRDTTMANSIMDVSKDEGWETVVISCGQEHVDPIQRILEDNGWTVKPYEGNYRWFWKLGGLFNPIAWAKFVIKIRSWIQSN